MLMLKSLGGFDLRLHHSSFTGELPQERATDLAIGLVAVAGPITSALMCAIGLLAARRGLFPKASLAFSLAASVHFVSATFGGLLNLIYWTSPVEFLLGTTGHDALDATRNLGLPYFLIVGAGLAMLVVVWRKVLRSVSASAGRGAATALAVGVLLGAVLWTAALGPLTLP